MFTSSKHDHFVSLLHNQHEKIASNIANLTPAYQTLILVWEDWNDSLGLYSQSKLLKMKHIDCKFFPND